MTAKRGTIHDWRKNSLAAMYTQAEELSKQIVALSKQRARKRARKNRAAKKVKR